ncbi:branched-chain amino acid ABC transporter permease [Bacillota bacterium Meth-B3]|nr:branched-chain amino acid ABC transporter permease [Christensenellaceae bacterium]MEA5064556.1 branched-chain amino acid ABC transporter permease [Eubacteriales bacterium]MEA5067451.1 branched-chain amino acid ABC transporter permease [Christensenellaceae bacterium]
MDYILSQLMNGLCQGAIYALMAIGYSVIVGVAGMVTFTYGEIMMIGAFSAYYIFLLVGKSLWVAIPAAFLGSFLIGIVVYKVCYERFFSAPRHISLLCTIGISTLLKNLAQIVFGPDTKPIQGVIDNQVFTLRLFGAVVNVKLLQIVIIALVVALAILLTLFFNKTRWGVMLRAVSQNRDASYLVGIDVKRVTMMGNSIGCGFGGIAGILLAVYYYTVYSTMGGIYSIKAFSSSVLGGLVDLRFSALGGLCLGVIENLGITFSSASFRDIFAFGFLILMLIVRPQGFASKKGSRV